MGGVLSTEYPGTPNASLEGLNDTGAKAIENIREEIKELKAQLNALSQKKMNNNTNKNRNRTNTSIAVNALTKANDAIVAAEAASVPLVENAINAANAATNAAVASREVVASLEQQPITENVSKNVIEATANVAQVTANAAKVANNAAKKAIQGSKSNMTTKNVSVNSTVEEAVKTIQAAEAPVEQAQQEAIKLNTKVAGTQEGGKRRKRKTRRAPKKGN